MRKIACALLLAAPLLGQANPTAQPQGLDEFLAEKGLLAQVEDVRQQVGHKANELVMTAMGFLGIPYRKGGESADTGFDCSGFVRAIYEQSLGLVLPRRAAEQAHATQQIDKAELKPGDLVFFNTLRRTFSHVGIYMGDGKFIHSPRAGAQVRVEDMRTSYWSSRFDGARRVVNDTPANPTANLSRLPSTP